MVRCSNTAVQHTTNTVHITVTDLSTTVPAATSSVRNVQRMNPSGRRQEAILLVAPGSGGGSTFFLVVGRFQQDGWGWRVRSVPRNLSDDPQL